MTNQEKKAAFEGALSLLVKNPAAKEQILNQYADTSKSSPMAANLAGMIASAITKRRTEKEQAKKQEKKAEFSWDKVTGEIEKLRNAFNKQDATTKAILATGGGALGGMILSSLFGGKAGRGAMLGAMAGGASQVDWRKVLQGIEDARSVEKVPPAPAALPK